MVVLSDGHSMKNKVSLIVAMDENNGIGYENSLPWEWNREDMLHFMETTEGSTVIMGRNTWNSLPKKSKPLKNRYNFVVSSTLSDIGGVEIVPSLEDALKTSDEVYNVPIFNIGGAQLYKFALDNGLVDRLIISHFQGKYNSDTFSPNFLDNWKVNTKIDPIVKNVFTIKEYIRK